MLDLITNQYLSDIYTWNKMTFILNQHLYDISDILSNHQNATTFYLISLLLQKELLVLYNFHILNAMSYLFYLFFIPWHYIWFLPHSSRPCSCSLKKSWGEACLRFWSFQMMVTTPSKGQREQVSSLQPSFLNAPCICLKL